MVGRVGDEARHPVLVAGHQQQRHRQRCIRIRPDQSGDAAGRGIAQHRHHRRIAQRPELGQGTSQYRRDQRAQAVPGRGHRHIRPMRMGVGAGRAHVGQALAEPLLQRERFAPRVPERIDMQRRQHHETGVGPGLQQALVALRPGTMPAGKQHHAAYLRRLPDRQRSGTPGRYLQRQRGTGGGDGGLGHGQHGQHQREHATKNMARAHGAHPPVPAIGWPPWKTTVLLLFHARSRVGRRDQSGQRGHTRHGPAVTRARCRKSLFQAASERARSSATSWATPKRPLSSRVTRAIAHCGSWVKNRCTLRASLSSRKARFSSISSSALRS